MDLTPEQKEEVFDHCDWLYEQHERLGGHISCYIKNQFGITMWQAEELTEEWQQDRGLGEGLWAYVYNALNIGTTATPDLEKICALFSPRRSIWQRLLGLYKQIRKGGTK